MSDAIDRISPTLPPDSPAVMQQHWLRLLFLHWEVPVSELQSMLPPGLDVDTHDGKAYVTVLPFSVEGARPSFLPPIPAVSNFDEVNVRTYVHRQGRDPGIWFFSIDASSTIAVNAARTAYLLPYLDATITSVTSGGATPRIEFDSQRRDERGPMPAHVHVKYGPEEGPVSVAASGTLDFFLLERYILYTADSSRRLYMGRVHHDAYRHQRAWIEDLDETVTWAAGVKRSGAAPSLHYVDAVRDVKIYTLQPL
jgi:uncharacterized protein YqjF (DUF2071 family)